MNSVLNFFTKPRQPDSTVMPFVVVLTLVTTFFALCNLLVPAGSVFHISTYTITLLGKYLSYALLALAVDVVWGYCGILSLGHGAFFALGGYGMGMYLMRQIGAREVYGNPVLPDFMVFLDWKELPWYWLGMSHFPFAMLMALLVPCKNTRTIGKADMVHNHWLPNITVDPQTYEVRADGELLTCEPATVLPLAQLYNLF